MSLPVASNLNSRKEDFLVDNARIRMLITFSKKVNQDFITSFTKYKHFSNNCRINYVKERGFVTQEMRRRRRTKVSIPQPSLSSSHMNEYYNSSNVLEGNEFCGLWFPGSQNYLYFYRSSRMISVWCIFLDTKVSVPIYRVPIRKKIETQHIVRFDYIWPVVEPGG